MRSEPASPECAAGDGSPYRRRLANVARAELRGHEQIVALLPFGAVPKRPKGPEGKVRFGIRQSWRRYRPLVVTDRRLLVFDSGRTPGPRTLLAAFALEDVSIGPVTAGRWGTQRFELSLPGEGAIPFETGRREARDLEVLQTILVT